MKHKLILLLLGLLGAGCGNNDSSPENHLPTPEYGSPHADYRVSGKVIAPDGAPIPGIEVSHWKGYPEAVTDAEGHHLVEEADLGILPSLTFTGPDSPANGGTFAEKTMPAEFTEADRTGRRMVRRRLCQDRRRYAGAPTAATAGRIGGQLRNVSKKCIPAQTVDRSDKNRRIC